MALNFPDSPTLNQVYTDTTSGFSYQWDGVVWKSYASAASKNISIVDDISGSFNSSTQTFALAVSGTSLTPANAQQLRVVLGGIVQEPGTDYTVSGSNITFTTPPTGGLDCSIVSLGPAVAVGVPGDGTITPAKLSTGGPSWNSGGDVYISGITTITNASGTVIAGIGTTALIVEGNARVTGILTIGTSSITLDGTNNEIKIGTGVTISSTGITGSASTVTSAATAYGLSGTPNLIVGVTTASRLSVGGSITELSQGQYWNVVTQADVGIGASQVPLNQYLGQLAFLDEFGTNIPQNAQTASYTLVRADAGKHISITTGGVTVPAGVFEVGDAVTIYNNSGSNQTITQGGSVTMRSAGTANTGNRTLAQYGLCTVLCVASNTFVISGVGLS